MNLLGILEFLSVVENHSFTAAAKQLKTSVAHISRQVSALEDRLGVKLLHRTTRKVTPTDLGQQYYQQCRPLFDGLKDAENSIINLHDKPVGHLHVTAPVAFGERIIAPLLSDFLNQYPNLQINLELTNRKLDLIEGSIDLAIRLGNLESSNLKARKLSTRHLHICAAPGYIEKYGTPYSLSELNNHNCLLGTLDYWKLSDKGKNKNIRVSGNMRCNSGPALLCAALMGNGIVQLPDYYVSSHISKGELIPLLKSYDPETEGIWAVYPPSRHMLPKVRIFIDFLTSKLSKA